MGVDYSSAGGVGFVLSEELLSKATAFTKDVKERYDECKSDVLDKLLKGSNLLWCEYGNAFTGRVDYMVVIKYADTLVEAWERSELFLEEFNKIFGTTLTKSQIQIVCEYYVS